MDKTKTKRILRWAAGTLLALLALLMLFSFFTTVLARDRFGQPRTQVPVFAGIFWWLVILGAGVPGTLLLRAAVRETLAGRKDPESEENSADCEE